MAAALGVVVVGLLLCSSSVATSDEQQVKEIYNKLEERVEATIDTYSDEEILELERGISQCNMILKEVDSMNFFNPDEETKQALYLSSKQCMVHKMMKFLNIKNETLGLKLNEIEYLEEMKPILDKYSSEKEEIATTSESYSTSGDIDAKSNSKNEDGDVENTDHNMEKDSKTTEINSRYVVVYRENVTNVGDENKENGTNPTQVNSKDSDGNINIDSNSTEVSSTHSDEKVNIESESMEVNSTYSDANMDTHTNVTESNSTFTDVNVDSQSKSTDFNSTDSDGNMENGVGVTKATEDTSTDSDGNMETGVDVTKSTEDTSTDSDGNMETGVSVTKSTEDTSTDTDGNIENGVDVTKFTEDTSTDSDGNMENGVDVTKFTEDTSADSDGNLENGVSVTKSTEDTSADSDGNMENVSTTEVNYNYSDGNMENFTKHQNESSSRLLDIPTPIFLESLLSKILSGIFGVLILMMICGTLIGCCFLIKYNCKTFKDDLVPLETSANDDVILEFYSSEPESPVPEKAGHQRMITTPLLVNQIDNLNPVSSLDPSEQHHLLPPQSSHLQPQ